MNIVIRNALSLLSSQITTMLVAVVVIVIVPDYLGEVDYGRFSFALIFVGVFGFLGGFGTTTYLTKVIARDPSLVGRYVYSTLALKLLMAAILSASALGLAAALRFDGQTMLLIAAACLTMSIMLLNEVVSGALFGLERMTGVAAWAAVGSTVTVAAAIIAVLMHADVTVYAFVVVPPSLIPLCANLFNVRQHLQRGVNVAVWRVVLSGGFPFLIVGVIQLIYGSDDMLMLRPLAGDATVGWYALAYRWISLPVTLASAALVAMFPALSVRSLEPDEGFSRMANRALKFVALISFPAAIGIAVVADDLISVAYGGQFRETVPLMQILAVSIPVVVVDMVLAIVMLASDRQRQWMIIGAFAVIANPLLNLIAIPYTVDRFGNGAIGAATVTGFTELVIFAGAFHYLPSGVMTREVRMYMLRCVLAAAMMAVIVLSVSELTLVPKIAVGVLAYLVAAWFLKVATRGELEWYRAQLRTRRDTSLSPPTSAQPFPSPTNGVT